MQVRAVRSDTDLQRFIRFPWTVYRNDPNWVPPLISEVKELLSARNPFWEHAVRELFLAFGDDGRVRGRIAAIIDHNYVRFHNEPTGFFGFFESLDEPEAARALVDAAATWLRDRDIRSVIGPMNPSTNDECGLLCEGYGSPPRLMMPHTPPYYHGLMGSAGLQKVKELYAYDMDVTDRPLERLTRLRAVALRRTPGLSVRTLDPKKFTCELDRAISIYNAAWEKNWGFVPWTEREFHAIADKLRNLFQPQTTVLAEVDGKPAGMLIAVPDYNIALKRMNGRLLPTGVFKFLYYRRKIDALRLMIMGVVREYRHRGIEGAMYHEALTNSLALGYRTCEFSWVLDDNVMTQRAAEMMGGRLYKKYRIYGMDV